MAGEVLTVQTSPSCESDDDIRLELITDDPQLVYTIDIRIIGLAMLDDPVPVAIPATAPAGTYSVLSSCDPLLGRPLRAGRFVEGSVVVEAAPDSTPGSELTWGYRDGDVIVINGPLATSEPQEPVNAGFALSYQSLPTIKRFEYRVTVGPGRPRVIDFRQPVSHGGWEDFRLWAGDDVLDP